MTGVVPSRCPPYLDPDPSSPKIEVIQMARNFLLSGAIFGFLSVAIGAFGAHGLRARLDERALEVLETGVRYQMSHALALLVIALLLMKAPSGWLAGAGWAMVIGILLFSGSLYALALSGIRGFGAVAPLGGTALLIGWVLLAIGGWRLTAGGGG